MTRLRSIGNDTFRSLRIRNFRLFFFGQALSQNGTWMQLVAIDLLVLRLTNDGVAVGLATAFRLAPILLLGAWGGLLSDRRDRHHLLLGLNAAGAVVAAMFALTVATGRASIGVIYALAALSGIITAIENPPRRAIVTDLVEPREVTNAVGLNSAMMVSSKVTGPAIAGVLITTTSIAWCFVVNALSYLPQLLLFARMNRREFQPIERVRPGRGQIRDGLRYVWRTPQLRLPLMLVMATGAMNFNYPVILPLLATRDLGGGAGTYTLLLSVMSIGSVMGSLAIARRRQITNHYLAMAAISLAGVSALLAVAPTVALAALATIPVGIATMTVNSGSSSLVQLESSSEMRGRVLALMSIVFVGSAPLGAPLVGWIAEVAGARTSLAVGALTALLAGLLVLHRIRMIETGSEKTDRPEPAPLARQPVAS